MRTHIQSNLTIYQNC